jgi:hypothetical protein
MALIDLEISTMRAESNNINMRDEYAQESIQDC